jgi:hypothetical protein
MHQVRAEMEMLPSRLVRRDEELKRVRWRLEQEHKVTCSVCCGTLSTDDINPGAACFRMRAFQTRRELTIPGMVSDASEVEEVPYNREDYVHCRWCDNPVHHSIECSVILHTDEPLRRSCRVCLERIRARHVRRGHPSPSSFPTSRTFRRYSRFAPGDSSK